MSAKSKGNEYEREVKKYLEATNFSVFRCHRKPIFIKGKMLTMGADIFGCDIVAKKIGLKPKWIQVSTVENKSKKVAQVEVFPWNLAYEDVELWLRIPGKKAYRIFVLVETVREVIDDPDSGVGVGFDRSWEERDTVVLREAAK